MTFQRAVTALGLGLAAAILAAMAAGAAARAGEPVVVEIAIHYSHYTPSSVTVPLGRPVTFVIRNDDPIDHEWIIGDATTHERHRTGTEAAHGSRPTEISIPALAERRTTITFDSVGSLQFICHLPGHEAYGMVGTVTIRAS
jgi:uncharacterized cupredoxin-like copper-binding protein